MNKRHLTISALALILMSACTEATGVEPVDLAGTWTAASLEFTSVEHPELTADLVDEGANLSLLLDAEGGFTLTFTFPQAEDEVDTGTYEVEGSSLTLSDSIELTGDVYDVSRNGDTMTLTIADVFDFVEGTEEAATLVITLTR